MHGYTGMTSSPGARNRVAANAQFAWLHAGAGMRRVLCSVSAAVLLAAGNAALAFDHAYAPWDALLQRHVVVAPDGKSSRVDYAGLGAERSALQACLDGLSSITQAEYSSWTRAQRLAFLINAYNAYTVQLVLTRYPDLKSIKDLGSLINSPWKKKFFVLLGAERSLDDVEHSFIRAPGAFDEPRIHFALNCASVGCPMLRDHAYVAEGLEAQLEDSVRRFLGDRSRNRYDPASGALEVSRIFDWYKADFDQGEHGAGSVSRFLARYAEQLADGTAARASVQQGQAKIRYLDYDWTLNDAAR